MIRSRALALLAALLLLPGEAARAGAWCAATGGQTMTPQAARVEREAAPGAAAAMPASHAAHHAMMMHDRTTRPTTADAAARSAVPTSAPTKAPASAPHHGPSSCPLMAACASAAVAIRVTLNEVASDDIAQRVNADEPAALATRTIAPEPPPPR